MRQSAGQTCRTAVRGQSVARRVHVMCALAVTAMAGLAVPAASSGQTVVPAPGQAADAKVVPVMDRLASVLVWSELSPVSSPGAPGYSLHVLRDGQDVRLPVANNVTPFDVDLGLDGKGGVVAVYSRCARPPQPNSDAAALSGYAALPYPAWTGGTGCDLYRLDFSDMQETRIAGASTSQASEVLPSIWEDRIAFVRVYAGRDGARAGVPQIYVRSLSGGRSQRLPGGPRGVTGGPGPTRLDLHGRRLAFVWNRVLTKELSRDRAQFESTVRLDTVHGGQRVLGRATAPRPDLPGLASYVSPRIDRGTMYYGFQRAILGEAGTSGRSLTSLLLRYQLGSGAKAVAQSPGFLVDAATGDGQTSVGIDTTNFDRSAYDGTRTIVQLNPAYG